MNPDVHENSPAQAWRSWQPERSLGSHVHWSPVQVPAMQKWQPVGKNLTHPPTQDELCRPLTPLTQHTHCGLGQGQETNLHKPQHSCPHYTLPSWVSAGHTANIFTKVYAPPCQEHTPLPRTREMSRETESDTCRHPLPRAAPRVRREGVTPPHQRKVWTSRNRVLFPGHTDIHVSSCPEFEAWARKPGGDWRVGPF